MKERQKNKDLDFFDEVDNSSIIIPEDLEKIQKDINDLENETNHLVVLRGFEVSKNEDIFKKQRIEREQLREQIEA